MLNEKTKSLAMLECIDAARMDGGSRSELACFMKFIRLCHVQSFNGKSSMPSHRVMYLSPSH